MVMAAAAELGRGVEAVRLGDDLEPAMQRTLYRARAFRRIALVRADGALRTSPALLPRIAQLAGKLGVTCVVLVRVGELDGSADTRFSRIATPHLDGAGRRRLWQSRLAAEGLTAADLALGELSTRYDLPPGRIGEVAVELGRRHLGSVEIGDVRTVLRDVTVQRIECLASRYSSSLRLDHLIVSGDVRARLDELVGRLSHRHRVLSEWAFAGRSRGGFGVAALFCGPPGTGKTAAAGAVANALDIDLFVVDLSRILSKWVGETEQNLARIFDEAEASGAALLFDEADALFGKRTTDGKGDQHANVTINYLLTRMETFSGLAILTTNFESALDKAFARRLATRISFPEPDADERLALWERLLPPGASYARDVRLDELSAHKMSGARIQTALVRAAFRAASAGRKICVLRHDDLLAAATLEYEDMGRLAGARRAS
jgi:hypothetical protein